jgi:dTDP-4-dehydrorhamnose 3,5-epimerase
MVKIEPTAIPAVKLVSTPRHGDARGYFAETYSARAFAEAGIAQGFVQDNESMSAARFTVRGLHFQRPPFAQAKLVRVLAGRILDVALDIRLGSPTYGRHVAVELDAESNRQVFVPEGFAHGFCTLTEQARVLYKVSHFYAPAHEGGILWCDPDLAIDWPAAPERATLSERDRRHPRLRELAPCFNYAGD